MKLVQQYMTESKCYKANKKIKVKGLMIHSVGCPQPKASAFIRNWNTETAKACVHALIDGNDGTVYQTLPWEHRGWHCGSKANNTHIGVEMCEPSTIKYTKGSQFVDNDPAKTKEVVMRTYGVAVELFAYLCKEYNLDPEKDIIGHAEGHAKGVASNHGDPDHLWKKFGLSMNGFRADVKAAMGKATTDTTHDKEVAQEAPELAPARSLNKAFARSYETITDLNLRWGAGTDKKIVKVLKKGARVSNYGYYTQNGSTIWMLVKDSTGAVGYCSKRYLK